MATSCGGHCNLFGVVGADDAGRTIPDFRSVCSNVYERYINLLDAFNLEPNLTFNVFSSGCKFCQIPDGLLLLADCIWFEFRRIILELCVVQVRTMVNIRLEK